MRICLMTSTYKLSEGDPNVPWLVENVRHLVKGGAHVHVFAPSYEGLGSQVLDGVPVYRFRYFFKKWENLTHKQGAPNRIRHPLYLFVAFFYILSGLVHALWFCTRHRFDLIHVHWPFPHGIWGYVASRLSGAPMVLTFHGAEVLLSKKFFFVKYFLRHACKNASAIICNSSYTAKQVAELTDKPINVIPFGCTVEARPALKKRHKAVKDILYVGRLVTRKGVDNLLKAVPLLARQVPMHLHVVGDGDQGTKWKALAHDLKLDGQVTFHGKVSKEELERQYANGDVFVLPAIIDERGDTEGLGVVLVEALNFKVPVVASSVGGIPDVIQDGVTGLLVPEKDPGALAEAVRRIVRDPQLAQGLTEHGLEYAREYFDWDRIIDLQLKVYQSVVALAPLEGREPAHAGYEVPAMAPVQAAEVRMARAG